MNGPFQTVQQLPTTALPVELEALAPPPLLLPGESLDHYTTLQQAIFADLAPRSAIEWLQGTAAGRGGAVHRFDASELGFAGEKLLMMAALAGSWRGLATHKSRATGSGAIFRLSPPGARSLPWRCSLW